MKELVVTKAAVTTYLQFLKIQEKKQRNTGKISKRIAGSGKVSGREKSHQRRFGGVERGTGEKI